MEKALCIYNSSYFLHSSYSSHSRTPCTLYTLRAPHTPCTVWCSLYYMYYPDYLAKSCWLNYDDHGLETQRWKTSSEPLLFELELNGKST